MRCSLAFATILAAIPIQAMARNDEVEINPAIPAWAQISAPLDVPPAARGTIFNRRLDAEIHLDKSGEQAFSSSLVRILDTNGLQVGNIQIAWNPASGKAVVHAVKVHRDGAVRDVLATTKFELLRRERQLEAASLDGIMTAALRVPDLRVGDDLEVSFTLPSQDPTLGADSFGLLIVAPSPPPGRYHLQLMWEPGQEPDIRPSPDLAASLQRDARSVALLMDNPAPLSPPKQAPPRYNWQRIVSYSDFKTWQATSIRMEALFAAATRLSAKSAVKDEAAAIAAANPGPMARAAAALRLVQQQVRYVYVGLNGRNFLPASADETWQRRYGDCKGKTVLLLALLQELGIPAEAVLVNNNGDDDGLDARLPGPNYFDHVLVKAEIDGKSYWLDGTLPPVYRPTETAALPYRWVLPLRAAGATLAAVPWQPPERPDEFGANEIDAKAGFGVPAKRRQIIIKRGIEALLDYYRLSSVTEDQLQAAIKQSAEGTNQWNTVEKVTWRFDEQSLASVLEISGIGPVDWEKQRNGSYELILPGGGFSPPDRRQRGGEMDKTIPFYTKPGFDCYVTTVRLPGNTAAKDWSYNTSYDTKFYGRHYRRQFDRRDGAITMMRVSRTIQNEVDWAAATVDNARLPAFDASMAQIFYDPNSADTAKPSPHLPTAGDNDWAVHDSACLAFPPVGASK